MKKKKFNKIFKLMLLICMIFSQIATPLETLAAEIIPNYNFEIIEQEDNNFLNIKMDEQTDIDETKDYILEVKRNFTYVDSPEVGAINDIKYAKVKGIELVQGYNKIEIIRPTTNSNGKTKYEVKLYDVISTEIDLNTINNDEEIKNLLAKGDTTVKLLSNKELDGKEITENLTSIKFNINGNKNIIPDTENPSLFHVSKEEVLEENLLELSYELSMGNFNSTKNYHTTIKINGIVVEMISDNIINNGVSDTFVLDFSKMLPGTYNIEYIVSDKEYNEIIYEKNNITFVYEDISVLDKLELFKENVTNDVFNNELVASYSVLTETEKNTLGNSYRYLDSPLAYIFDVAMFNGLNINIKNNYNHYNDLDKNDNTRYHVITSDNFKGAFKEEDKYYKVLDVLNYYNNKYDYVKVNVLKSDNSVASSSDYIQNGMKLEVNILGEKYYYDFLVYGDVNGGYVEDNDIQTLIEKVLNGNFTYYDQKTLDYNNDNKIDSADISLLGYNILNKDYTKNEYEPTDIRIPNISVSKNELFIDETFDVYISFKGFNKDEINTFDSLIEYDNNVLQLTTISPLNSNFNADYTNNRFIAASSISTNSEENLFKLTFKAITEGNTTITLKDTKLYNDGLIVKTNNSNTANIIVNRRLHTDSSLKSLTTSIGTLNPSFSSDTLEYNIYVDGSVNSISINGELNDEFAKTDGFKNYTLTGGLTPIHIKVLAEDGTSTTYTINVNKIYKSSNNNLSNLTIKDHDIKFNKNKLEYEIDVDSDTESLDISAFVEDGSAWVKIEGNENFKEGKNTVSVTVYAEDGSTKTYKIIANKAKAAAITEDEEDEEKSNNVNTEKIIIIILIILVVIGLLYLIFKNDDEDDEEIRVEQIKPKKEVNHQEKNSSPNTKKRDTTGNKKKK